MASKGGPVSLTFRNSGAIANARDLRGRFVSIQSEVKAAHTEMAQALQDLQVEELRTRIEDTGRPQRDSEYLIQAIAAEGNREVSIDGFVVGIESFLDSSHAAPYWRHIEEGYSGFVGRTVYGFFRSPEGVASGPSRDRYRRDLEMIQTSAPVYKQGGKTHVSKTSVRSDVGSNDSLGRGGGGAGSVVSKITISHPIPAYEFMATGIKQWQASGIEVQAYKRALREFSDLINWSGGTNVGSRSSL